MYRLYEVTKTEYKGATVKDVSMLIQKFDDPFDAIDYAVKLFDNMREAYLDDIMQLKVTNLNITYFSANDERNIGTGSIATIKYTYVGDENSEYFKREINYYLYNDSNK